MRALPTCALAFLLALLALPGSAPRAQQTDNDVHVLQVRERLFMLATPGGNVTMQVGDEGILLVDTGGAAVSDRLLATIKQVSNGPIRYIINTSADPDRAGGNENIVKKTGGVRLPAASTGRSANVGVVVLSHENTSNRLIALTGQDRVAEEGLPMDTFFGEYKNLYFNDEGIKVLFQPKAHTDGDVMVYFRRSDVVSAGNVFITTIYPIIDMQHGGTIQGVLDALNNILDITIPERNEQGGTLVIPGRGRLCNQTDVTEYRNAMTTIRNRIQSMVARGMTLEQVKGARPTLDYDGVYGATTGPWTTDMFIEAVYKTVDQPKK